MNIYKTLILDSDISTDIKTQFKCQPNSNVTKKISENACQYFTFKPLYFCCQLYKLDYSQCSACNYHLWSAEAWLRCSASASLLMLCSASCMAWRPLSALPLTWWSASLLGKQLVACPLICWSASLPGKLSSRDDNSHWRQTSDWAEKISVSIYLG